MKCSCPKCHAEIELSLAEVTDTGTPADCPLCSAKLVVHRESFAARIYRKGGEISCASCGEILGPQTYCASCGINFPDYLVVSPGRKPLSKVKKVKLGSNPFAKQFSINWALPTLPLSAPRQAAPVTSRGGKERAVGKPVLWGITGVVAVAIVAGGVLYYQGRKAAEEYTRNFINTVYCMETAAERSINSCTQLAADQKAAQTAAPKLSADEERDLRTLKRQIDNLMQKMKEPPQKYVPANDKLSRLYTSYLKINGLALNPPPVAALPDSVAKVDNDYKVAAKSFKSGLPEDLLEALRQASKRHPNLKALVD